MIRFKSFPPIPPEPDKTLLNIALDHKVPLNNSCGGNGSCGTCRVIFADIQTLPERNELEAEFAADRFFEPNERLACQTKALPGLPEIQIPNYKYE